VQYTMHILDLDEAMICVLQGTKVELVRIPRNHSGGEKLYKLARTFWDDFVVKGGRATNRRANGKSEKQKGNAQELCKTTFQFGKATRRNDVM
jgi:hypothetical protein